MFLDVKEINLHYSLPLYLQKYVSEGSVFIPKPCSFGTINLANYLDVISTMQICISTSNVVVMYHLLVNYKEVLSLP